MTSKLTKASEHLVQLVCKALRKDRLQTQICTRSDRCMRWGLEPYEMETISQEVLQRRTAMYAGGSAPLLHLRPTADFGLQPTAGATIRR